MRLPISSSAHRIIRNRSVSFLDNNMPSSNTYSFQLPYLGVISLGKSPLNLTSFQKPLRELYISYNQDERRIIVTDSDILIFESDRTAKSKSAFIYSKLESIIDVQILKLSIMNNKTENQSQKHMQAAFLPIGYEFQERFRSLYLPINKTQFHFFSSPTKHHPSLLLFVLRKPGITGLCSLLDCHVFAVHRESIAFELCDMIRKLLVKQTISPVVPRREICFYLHDQNKDEKNIKTNDHLISKVNLNNVARPTTNILCNPLSLSSVVINDVQHARLFHNTSKVLPMNSDVYHRTSPSKQRHFIKISSSIPDESEEIVNDLMNIVATEELKTQLSNKRHASFDQTSPPNDCGLMNKKRYFQNKKRLLNPIPTTHDTTYPQKPIPMIDGQLLRPHIVLNRYGDIGNYVPKFLREKVTVRSSDSNENIFFRSTNGHLLNGFLQSDILSTKPLNENHYQSTPCLNHDENIYSLVRQLQTKSYINMEQNDSNEKSSRIDVDHRIPLKSKNSSRTKRVVSFTIGDTELPVDYRQYLRHTDQGVYLYGAEQRQTLEHSLGYLP